MSGGGWWRRNAGGLITLAVLVPASWFALDTIEFGLVRNPVQTVAPGDTVTVGASRYGPVTLSPLDAGAVGAPAQSRPMLVTIPVITEDGKSSCFGAVVTESASGRTWRSASSMLRWEAGEGQQESCSSDPGAKFDLVTPVLLGDDAAGPYEVVVSVGRESDVLDVRFRVGD